MDRLICGDVGFGKTGRDASSQGRRKWISGCRPRSTTILAERTIISKLAWRSFQLKYKS